MIESFSGVLQNAKDEIMELLSSFIDEVKEELDEAVALLEQGETIDAIDAINETQEKMDNWLKAQQG